jgi:hypothetical protein
MRVRRAFRPQVCDLLEDRVVPSPATLQPPAIVMGHPVPLPPPLEGSPQVQQAFAVFTQFYVQAVDDVLLAPGPNGSVDPAANRAAFDAAVSQALDTLAGNLVSVLGNVPLNSPAVSEVIDTIIGADAGSLESLLMAQSTASIEQAAAAGTPGAVLLPAIGQALARLTGQTPTANSTPVPQATAAATAVPANFAGDDAAATPTDQILTAVRDAFGSFLTAYYLAQRDVLLAPGPDGTINPAANRPAFDEQVSAALRTLVSAIEQDLADGGTAMAAKSARAQDVLVGEDRESLQNQLGAVQTPAESSAALVREFTLSSFRIVMQAFAVVSGDLREQPAPVGSLR